MKKLILSALLTIMAMVTATAQSITVHGSVWGLNDDEPLIGATVAPAGDPTKGVTTDIDGNFTITVPKGTRLSFSYIGYMRQVVEATPEMKVVLQDDALNLQEIVVTGYTTQRKADLTGAVAVMDMKQPISENAGSIINSMQGRMPGVSVTTNAAPGGGGEIRVRGMSTVNSNAPLYIVDGIATDNITSINPSDIESMQVLKDAASASIYGSRAANGVIIITTRQGKGDKLQVNVNYSASVQFVGRTYDMLNAEQWGQAYWTAAANSHVTPSHPLYGNGATPQLVEYIDGNPNFRTTDTDWQDAVYRSAWTNNLTASVSNSSDRGSFMFSANYINQDGVMRETFYRRYSARVNSTYNISKYFQVGENLMVANWSDRGFGTGDDRGIPFTAMRQHPALPVKGLDGDWARPMDLIASDIANPVQTLYNGRDNENNSWRIFGNMFLAVMPVDGLTLKTNFGLEHIQYFNKNLVRKTVASDVNEMSRAYGQGDTWTWTNTANYVKTFNEKHHINVLFGVEAIKYTFEDLSAARKDYAFEDNDYMQIGSGEGTQTNGGGKSQWALFSVFGKADYNYADRYLASFTLRRDASSRLDKRHNSGVFPAFTLAWRPTQETFFPTNNVFNDLKVRFAWGQNGNSAIDNLYAAYTTYKYDLGNGAYDLNGTGNGYIPGVVVDRTGNPNLKWETTTQTNIGVDFGFLNNSLSLSFDYYIKKTTDMLTQPPVLAVAGENAVMFMNTGDMSNNGFELQLNYISPKYGDFSWSGNFNISRYKNKLVKLNNMVNTIGGDIRLIKDQPMGVYYGYVYDGIFQTPDEVANHAQQTGAAPGRMKFRDLDGNGVINENDRCIIGDPNPDFSLGLNLDFKYRDFTLSTFFCGDFGFDIYNPTLRQLNFMGNGGVSTNRSVDVLNAWTQTNTSAKIPALALTDDNNETRMSTYYVEDGSYLKMKYIKLAYSLPAKVLRPISGTSCNVYAQLENVFTITKYSGLDPELPLGTYGARVDNGPYPRSRVLSLGLNLTF